MDQYENTQNNRRFRPLRYIIPATIMSLASLVISDNINKNPATSNQDKDSIQTYSATSLWENRTQYTDKRLYMTNSQSLPGTEKIDPFFEPGTSKEYMKKINSMMKEQRNSFIFKIDNEPPQIYILAPESLREEYKSEEFDNEPPKINIMEPIHGMNYIKLDDSLNIWNELTKR